MTKHVQSDPVHITISVINGCVLVQSSQPRPAVGNVLDAVSQLSLEIAMLASRSGAVVQFRSNPMLEFLGELITPEGYGHAIPKEVREHARRLMLSMAAGKGAAGGH